jgi:hypothetical protein
MFRDSSDGIEEYTTSVTGFINKCIEDVIPCVHTHPNQKPCVITLSVAVDVSKTFKQVNIHKAAGPDGLPGRMLQACADQLAGVFTDIFNMSLIESVIPTMFQADHHSPCAQEH